MEFNSTRQCWGLGEDMISFNLFSMTHQTGAGAKSAVKAASVLNINVKHDVNAANSSTSAAAISASRSSSVEDMFESLVDTNGVSNIQLLDKLGGKEDLKAFQNYIERFSINDSGQLKSLSEYNVKGMVNTIAAKYTSLSYQIENGNYSDAEKAEMQKRLDEQLGDGLDTLAERFGSSASELFANLGLGDSQKKTAGQSLVELVKQYKDEFTAFMDSDEGKEFIETALKENPDLLTDDVALTEAILYNKAERLVEDEKAKAKEAEVQAAKDAAKTAAGQDVTQSTIKTEDEEGEGTAVKSNLFTLEDLSSLGELQSSFNTFLNDNLNKSEEEIGYQLGLTYVKGQEILKEHGASELLTKMYTSNFDNFIESKLKSINTRLEDKQESAEETSSNADPNSYKSLDTALIKQTYNSVVNYYNATGSAMDAMISGFEDAKNSFLNNQANSSAVRYTVGSKFFDNFYTTQKGSGKSNSADMYSIGMSYYKRYTTAFGN